MNPLRIVLFEHRIHSPKSDIRNPKMPPFEPTVYDLRYQQLLEEALARAPVHNPEWTNFNDSDPGVTLLQLFAFLAESVAYRANLVPERNQRKFLQLLGLPLQPAVPAQGLVCFENPRGPLEVKTLLEHMELFAGPVPFRTQDALDVLPIEAQVYYKGKPSLTEQEAAAARELYNQLYASYQAPGVELELYETKLLEAPASGAALPRVDLNQDTVDGCLWVALLARTPNDLETTRAAIAGHVLSLGVVPALREAARVLLPQGQPTNAPPAQLVYELPQEDDTAPTEATPDVRYVPLETRPRGNVLAEPGVVELLLPTEAAALAAWARILERLDPIEAGTGDLPPSLEDTAVQDRLLTWLRIRHGETQAAGSRLRARFSYLAVNAARVAQRAGVFAELLGKGTGEPNQTVAVAQTPVLPESLHLVINGERWTQTDDLAAAPPEAPRRAGEGVSGQEKPGTRPEDARVYSLDPASGLIRFGDGLRGARPPREAAIQASYDYGGGLQGLVGIGSIKTGPLLPAGVKVSNPIPTWGAGEAETVDQALRRAPGFLRHRNRLVSEEDYRELTLRVPGVDIGRVEVLSLLHPDVPAFPAEGVVTVMVIPRFDPVQPEAPTPDLLFLNTVCAYLNPRRLITTEVHVRGPRYVPVMVSVGVEGVAGRDPVAGREAVEAALRRFLSPLDGGFERTGWPLGRDVETLELVVEVARVPGVAKVNGMLLTGLTGGQVERIPMRGLDLPRIEKLSVQIGNPLSLPALRGEHDAGGPPDGGPPPRRLLPVPLVPAEG